MMVLSPKIPWIKSLIVASVGGLSLMLIFTSQLILPRVFGPTVHGYLIGEPLVVGKSDKVDGPSTAPSVLQSAGSVDASSPSGFFLNDPENPPGSAQPNNSAGAHLGSCDLYRGKWIYDPIGPSYTNNSCPVLTQSQNCQGNGRPDRDYENWRWKPNQCVLPQFNARNFLERMRGKTLAFVGDSIARNQMESLLCILWQVETPVNRGNRRMQRWIFRSTSVTIIRIWSSWLVHKTTAPLQYAPSGIVKVHLDTPDEAFMELLPKFDVLVLSTGHWFDKQTLYILNNTIVGGRQRQKPKRSPMMKVDNVKAFGISVETALTGIATHPNYTGLTVLRTYTPDHYERGAWNTGGSCSGITSPSEKVARNGYTDLMHEKQIGSFRAAAKKLSNGSKIKLLDITELSGYRHDGHPGQYRSLEWRKAVSRPPQDCLHWCMPGPVDTWNEILFEIIRREFDEG